ncbi:Putative proximal rod protein [Moellerella wisconsensis]|nr:Putative proximal rod protein [Moellerella wisconsensis]
MDRVIYTAMGGVQQALSAQAIVGNNLANVSTNGFKAQLAAARTVEVTDPHGQATRMFPLSSTPGSDNRAGPINFTARSLDVALSDGGYLLVQLENGQQALTRNGNIQVSAEGQLTINGRPVMGGVLKFKHRQMRNYPLRRMAQ